MHLDIRWLDSFERALFLPVFRRRLRRLENSPEAHTQRNIVELIKGTNPLGVTQKDSMLVLKPQVKLGGAGYRLVAEEELKKNKPMFMLYGLDPEAREVTLHRLEDWGFVGLTEDGYRNFSWSKLHFLRRARSWSKNDFIRLELFEANKLLQELCDECERQITVEDLVEPA